MAKTPDTKERFGLGLLRYVTHVVLATTGARRVPMTAKGIAYLDKCADALIQGEALSGDPARAGVMCAALAGKVCMVNPFSQIVFAPMDRFAFELTFAAANAYPPDEYAFGDVVVFAQPITTERLQLIAQHDIRITDWFDVELKTLSKAEELPLVKATDLDELIWDIATTPHINADDPLRDWTIDAPEAVLSMCAQAQSPDELPDC